MTESSQDWLEAVQTLSEKILRVAEPVITFEVLPLSIKELVQRLPTRVKIDLQKDTKLDFMDEAPTPFLECLEPIRFVDRSILAREGSVKATVMVPVAIILQALIHEWLYSRTIPVDPEFPIIVRETYYPERYPQRAVGVFCEIDRSEPELKIRIEEIDFITSREPATLMYSLTSCH